MKPKRFESGAQKRKKKMAEQESIAKLPKLSRFLKPVSVVNDSDPNQESVNVHCHSEIECNLPSTSTSTPSQHSGTLFDDDETANFPNCSDKANFLKPLTLSQKKWIAALGPYQPSGPFPVNDSKNCFSERYYAHVSKTGLQIPRKWLCYSPKLDNCYCQPCWLFGEDYNSKQRPDHLVWVNGYCDWYHISQAIVRHERSQTHLLACQSYVNIIAGQDISSLLNQSNTKEEEYGKKILQRIVHVICTLASQNLPLRGHIEKIESADTNKGNFLALVVLLSKYDPILNDILTKPKHSIRYLSPLLQNQMINCLGTLIKNVIISDVKSSLFYTLILDTTQDISKIDQLSIVIRYVTVEKDADNNPVKINIKEDFLGFESAEGQTGEALKNQVIKFVNTSGIGFEKLRGTGFDGAANMSGVYNGLQAKIKQLQKYSIYVHCATHNLNLVINDSVENISFMTTFFSWVQRLYVFFSSSILRWEKLKDSHASRIVLKKLCPTRWSSRFDSLKALRYMYPDVMKVLNYIVLVGRNVEEKAEAQSIQNYFEKFESIFLINFQYKLLSVLNMVSKSLQTPQTHLSTAASLLEHALQEVKAMRNNYPVLLAEASELAAMWKIAPQFTRKRPRKMKKFFDEIIQDERISDPELHFKTQVIFASLDIIIVQLSSRFNSLFDINKLFSLLHPANLIKFSDETLKSHAAQLSQSYPDDFSSCDLQDQIIIFKTLFKTHIPTFKTIHEITTFLMI